MIQQRLYGWMKHPEQLNKETLYELRSLLARYPYFQVARLLYLKNLYVLHDIAFGEELRKAALYISDRRMLFALVEGERFSVKSLEQKMSVKNDQGLDRTLALIDSFLSSLPEEPEVPAVIAYPVEAATDYTSYLKDGGEGTAEAEEETPKMKGQDLIDTFLEKSEEQPLISSVAGNSEEGKTEDVAEELDEESYFTETLARIYVKQQRYSKALEIIRRLNLKYPKKNAYFADQIRFLEKLIINANSK